MNELNSKIESMSYAELLSAYRALKECKSKGVRDELVQEAYALELYTRDKSKENNL